jgi:hypothetical protein
VEILCQSITYAPQEKAMLTKSDRKSLSYWELVFLRWVACSKFQGFVMGRQATGEAKDELSKWRGEGLLKTRNALPPAS